MMHLVTPADRDAAMALRDALADISGFWHRLDDEGPLCQAIARHRIEAEQRLMNQYRHLSAFAENHGVLTELARRGVATGILSNGDPEMLAVAVRSAGLQDLLNPVLSAHAVQRFKTDAAVYQLGPQALGLPAKKILFVSSNGWDAIGATWFGYRTLWVNRAGAPLEQLDTTPTRTAGNLRAVLDFFPAS